MLMLNSKFSIRTLLTLGPFGSKLSWVITSDDIGSGLWSMAVCFDFPSTNVVQLSNQNTYFYRLQCHHPLITQLTLNMCY